MINELAPILPRNYSLRGAKTGRWRSSVVGVSLTLIGLPQASPAFSYTQELDSYLASKFVVTEVRPTLVHDFYSGSRNPVTGSSCCGKSDCVPIPPGDVKYGNGSITFRYPLDGQYYTIPLNQTLPSPDGQNHGCVWGRNHEGGPKLCFFVGGGF